MSIFLISPVEPTAAVVPPVDVVANPETMQQVAEKTPVNDLPVNVISPNGPNKVSDKTIALDGPLSQVYVQALREMYSRKAPEKPVMESYITEIEAFNTLKEQADSVHALNKMAGGTHYAYVVHGHFLEDGGLTEAYDQIEESRDTCTPGFICIENDGVITDKIAHLARYARENGSQVFHDRQKFLAAIMRFQYGE